MENEDGEFSAEELTLLRSVIHAPKSLRCGSVNLAVRDGRLVENQKIKRIRIDGRRSSGMAENRNGF